MYNLCQKEKKSFYSKEMITKTMIIVPPKKKP
jgi:hypothetical protein